MTVHAGTSEDSVRKQHVPIELSRTLTATEKLVTVKTESNTFRFGRFSLDIRGRQLRCGEVAVNVGRLEFDILCLLAEANGDVVTKDEIFAKVWPGRVVEDNAIQVHVSALRKALDQADNAHIYVVTVPGRGYRFVGIEPPITVHENGTEDQIDPNVTGTSIVVMPFQNLSDEKEHEYFADGIVEDLVTGLSRMRSILVVARDSSLVYKGKSVDLKQVGRELGVRYVLEGSVRKAGNRIRIAVQLIEPQSGAHLWAESYDRPLNDIFSVQDEITMNVIGAIEPQLRNVEIERIKRKRPNDLNAYDLLLRAESIYYEMPQTAAKAIPLLEQALALEPDYASAHALLALSYHAKFSCGGLNDEDRKAAIQHAHAVLSLSSDDATTLARAAFVIALDEHDVATSLEIFDRALEISNSNIVALSLSAVVYAYTGKPELAIERAQCTLSISPFGNSAAYGALAIAYFSTKRYAEARDAALRGKALKPQYRANYILLAVSLLSLGHLEDAKAMGARALELDPSFTMQRWSVTTGIVPEVFTPLADAWLELGMPV
jgi:TolB-like protein/Tfp pilus assembly protein PilF